MSKRKKEIWKFNRTFRKFTALLLAVMLGVSLLPASALAEEEPFEDFASEEMQESSEIPETQEIQETPEIQEIQETPEIQEGTEDGTADSVLADETADPDETAEGLVEFAADNPPEFEFHYTCSAGGWAGFGANLIDENGDTISATVSSDYTLTNGRYTTTVDMPYTFSIADFTKVFTTNGTYSFQYATVTDPNYGDTEHTFDVWPNEAEVGAQELYGSEENPVVSVTIDGTANTENPNYGNETVNSKTWHFTLTYENGESVTIPIYGNADGANDNGGKYCPQYLEINLYFTEAKEAVLNLGNGNGTYSDGDYTGSNASGGNALRYGTGALDSYADDNGNVAINLPSDNDLGAEFTVLDSIGTEGETGYQPAVTIELGRAEAYDYKLIGWINIATGEYYDVSSGATTAEIDLSDDNVFYADWIAASYDHGSSTDEGLRDDTVSTSSFVTLRMFDYNELFNLYSTSLEQNGTGGETWTDSESLYSEPLLGKEDTSELNRIAKSFIFQNNGTTRSNVHVLSHANPARWNLWTANGAWADDSEYNFVLDAETYWNITSPGSTILGMLYDTNESSLGVHYVGDADYLFWVDENGYYTYDSAVSGASYNQSDGRFYVYDYDSDDSSDDKGFFPYNNYKDGGSSSNGLTDYWFGVNMEVNIYIPTATSVGSEENPVNQVNGEDMVFDFSGDDDIMIFIDGEMVVDMSGIHSTSYSRINFSTNTVTYSMGLDETGAPDTTGAGGKYSSSPLNLSAGGHTMQIFYMERGASASNLKMQFNVAPAWEYETGNVQTVTAEKVWEDSDGNVIEDTTNMPAVEVGLFDALEPATEDTFGYTIDGTKYTVIYTDDEGVARTYIYDTDGPTLTYIEGDVTGTDTETNTKGQVLDHKGYVVAWLDGETLYIRIDMQTLSEDNGWSYVWELLDADGSYEALELSEDSLYTTSSTNKDLEYYPYWSIIGDAELEEMLGDEGEGSGPIILTEAAQEAESTLGDTKEAKGYVIVATEDGVHTEQVDFSQIATMSSAVEGETTIWYGTYGVTSQSEIDALGEGALWYPVASGKTHRDSNNNEITGFYLYCKLDSGTYYLALNNAGDGLTVTEDQDKASEFYYDLLGEFMISTGENAVRVEIDENGEIKIDVAEWEAALDDVRIYTLSETLTSGFAFTATNTIQKVNIEGTKTWVDADNQDGVRPASITIRLWGDGAIVETVTITPDEDGNWNWNFTDLPKYSNGVEIEYTITETAVDGYETTIDGYDVINTHTPEKTGLNVLKSWDDEDDQDGIRPESVTVILTKNGEETGQTLTLDESNNWSGSFTGLDKYTDGIENVYGIVEVKVEGYEATIVTSEDSSEDTSTINITNTHIPETVEVSGSKTWVDNDNQDGVRPESITVRLWGDSAVVETQTITPDEDGNWSWSFTGLPKYNKGVVIVYNITEDIVPDYSTTYSEDGYDVINTHTPDQTSLTVLKVWDDSSDQDGIRPDEITVELLADGEETGKTLTLDESNSWRGSFTELDKYEDGGEEIEYTVNELEINDYTTVITGDAATGYVITNTHTPETIDIEGSKTWDDADDQDGIRPSYITIHLLADGEEIASTLVTEAENWSWNFSDLPKYADGKEIEYTITEDAAEGYETTADDYNFTNTHIPETVEVSGSKTWEDNDNQDGVRPAEITIHLLADGAVIDSVTVTAEEDWAWSFTGLPKYADGKEIVYTITEDAVADYTTEVNGYDVTNTHTPGKVGLNVQKLWDDADDQDGKRPAEITVELTKNGDKTGDSLVLTQENGWAGSFTDLDEYTDGEKNEYDVAEITVDGYTTSVEAVDGTSTIHITNTHTPETIDMEGSKTWDDNDNQDGVRPTSIIIRLWGDDEIVETRTVTPDEDGNWSWSFTNLPKYNNGVEIVYSVTEDAVPGYNTTYSADGYSVTNTHTPETIDLTGSKIWEDNYNQDGIRPTEITIHLLADGEETASTQVTAKEDWSWSFTGLPKYKNGTEIAYTVTETAVEGYETTYAEDGYTVMNTHTPETIDLAGSKTWEDNDDQDGVRPAEIMIHLLADGEEIASTQVTAQEDWAWSFTGLPKYADGKEIVYTITEDKVDDYTTEVNGYDVTNTHTPGKVGLNVQKLWDDADDQDGKRPDKITVELTKNGEKTGDSLVLTQENGWAGSFTDLDAYTDGQKNEYGVAEMTVDGYTTNVETVNGTSTIIITNTYTPATIDIAGSKTWDDADDQDGIRPDKITVRLLADGKAALDENSDPITATVTAGDNWSFSFKGLPKYRDHGTEIIYTVEEDGIEGYEAVIDGCNITNVHEPEKIDLPVEKIWEDNDNAYNHRPESIEVELIKDGEDTGEVITLSEETDWKGAFTGLARYEAGREIAYTVKELSDEALQYYMPKITYNDDGSVTIVNQRAYFDIDEEIVPEEGDRDTWVKSESVNEYNAIELEMSTFLPLIEPDELANGEFTMNFHEVLDSELILDEVDADFKVYIGGQEISHEYYTITLASGANPNPLLRLFGVSPIDDGCTFHVDVDLMALYTDGVISEEDLLGDTEIMIFFFADLEGTGLNGTYKSTVWYDVYDGEEWQYTSNEDVVYVYTYDISILKYDASKVEGEDYDGAALAGATLGLYYDPECEDPVSRNGEAYTVVSEEDGYAVFYGLAEGTYYVKEVEAPDGYLLSDEVLKVELGEKLDDDNYTYDGLFANTPESEEPGPEPEPEPEPEPGPGPETELRDISGKKEWDDDENKADARPDSITVNLYRSDHPEEVYDSKVVTAADGWAWSWTGLPKYDADGEAYAYTINEDKVEDYTATYYTDGNFNIKNTFVGEEGAEHPTSGPEKGGDTPKTGDTDHIGLWLALLAAGLAGMLAVLFMRQKRKGQKK